MPRTQLYPKLYQRFSELLPEIFSGQASLSQNRILEKIQARQITADQNEIDFLERNIGNYTQKARTDNIIMGSGPHQGFVLVATAPIPVQITDAEEEVGPQTRGIHQTSESFLHLPTTILLSRRFESKILSLPTTSNRLKYANPDMIMVRDSNISQAVRGIDEITPEIISKVESMPLYILSSLELKFDLGDDRRKWIEALTQTSINSSWANESWLVFMDSETNTTFAEMSDIQTFARQNGIGVIEILFIQPTEQFVVRQPEQLGIKQHIQAVYKPLLNIDRQTANERKNLIRKVHQLIREFDEKGSYLEEDGDKKSIVRLILEAYSNLSIQAGFMGMPSQADEMLPREGFNRLNGANGAVFQRICSALLNTEPIAEVDENYLQEIKGGMTNTEYGNITTLLEAMRTFTSLPITNNL